MTKTWRPRTRYEIGDVLVMRAKRELRAGELVTLDDVRPETWRDRARDWVRRAWATLLVRYWGLGGRWTPKSRWRA